ncbi:MAG TPA: dihydrolipoyl dehydrogenase [Methylomirabilota bacterium]|jgi:dihydrolipoamide dehydrogenase|nr:dihydrolipoyl dehydrogenase [Methylomirabilota bacterium]
MGELPREADLVVLGGGPGGYAAAFRAADLGLDTVLVEARGALGGECLHVGCIPSKALLGIAALVHHAAAAADAGVAFGPARIDSAKLRAWTQRSIDRLAQGLAGLAKARGVEVATGHGRFEGDGSIRVAREDAPPATLHFKHAIVATGSRPAPLPGLEVGPRVWDSSAALALPSTPARLLVVGGGYIGLELGSVYAALGAEVTVVELLDGLLPGVDRDLVAPLARRLGKQFKQILLGTKLTGMRDAGGAVTVDLSGDGAPNQLEVDQLLVAVGRRPLTDDLGLEHTRAARDARGFVTVDAQRRTADPRVLAIGDVAGEPMLAHKAIAEGLVAAEVAAGRPAAFEPLAVPAVVFTDPEVAWCGLTEADARARGVEARAVKVPWSASGRAVAMGRTDGLTKLVFEVASGRLLGVGLVGPHAGDLLAEGVLAVEMGAVAEDLAGAIHTHPTLSETLGEAAELFLGRPVHLPPPRG